ncbi:hypothetical protein KY359_00230 [Candidatus Woesearchaeota archaeon]|nr:hypothetical protein [Candidatus Woesearchaeota archaeon]
MIDDVIKQCVKQIASSDSARSQRHILLADQEQLDYFAQQPAVGNYDVRVVRGNAAIQEFFLSEGNAFEHENDKRHLYIILSDDSDDIPKLMAGMKYLMRRCGNQRSYRGITMFNAQHYAGAECTVSENLRGKELDLTKKISAFVRHELFSE